MSTAPTITDWVDNPTVPTITDWVDNPAAAGQQEEEQPTLLQPAIRETTEVLTAGFLMLLPPVAPRYLLVPDYMRLELRAFDLQQPSGAGVAVLNKEKDEIGAPYTAAVSANGDLICLSFLSGGKEDDGLRVYNTSDLLKAAEGGNDATKSQIAPRGQRHNEDNSPCAAGAAFSNDAARLFVLWKTGGGVTVHDPTDDALKVLRTLPFTGGNQQGSNYQLACSGGLLAAAAGGGDGSQPSSRADEEAWQKVQLWRVDAVGETELQTVENPDLADAVAIHPKGVLIAVGLRNGVVRLLKKTDNDTKDEYEAHVEIVAAYSGKGSPRAHTLCFNCDGSMLVAGRQELDDFTVYDVTSAAVVARFERPKSQAWSAAFSPSGDILVTGSNSKAQQCVFHRLLPPNPRFEMALSDHTNIDSADLVVTGEDGVLVAIASGSLVEVHTPTTCRLQKPLDEKLLTSQGYMKTAVRLHPEGHFVACVVAKKCVVVLSVPDGSESFRRTTGTCFQLCWSPKGKLLAMCLNPTGVQLISAVNGFEDEQTLLDGECVLSCGFDRSAAQFVTGTNTGRLTVFDTVSWTPKCVVEVGTSVWAVCFNSGQDRVAYADWDDYKVGVLSLTADGGGKFEDVVCKVNALCDLRFSPDDNFLLCCSSAERPFDKHRMRVLDLATGTDAEWGELLCTMALPVGNGSLCSRTLGWTQLPQPHTRAADTTGNSLQWVLYGAVGNRFVVMDIEAALYAIHDNAWAVDQLTFCSTHQQQYVGSLIECAPYSSNIRDMETGETVLHCLARMPEAELMENWLEKCPHVTPVANAHGQTAIQVAAQLEQLGTAQALWNKLTPTMTSVSASLVMQELTALSKTHPHHVQPFLMAIEPKVVRTLATFRTELARAAEVCGLPTETVAGSSSYAKTTLEQDDATNGIPSVWADKCPADSPKLLVASRVVVLPNLLGDAGSSPFHAIAMNCDASVFESKILQLIVQYKWEENVSSQRMRSLALYGFAFVTGALAMISSVMSGSTASALQDVVVNALQGVVVVIEVTSLGVEVFEVKREGCAAYLTGPWNLLDVVSSGLLLFGSAFHFAGAMEEVRIAGGLGVALKCFGMVDYLRSWPATGSLVRMITVIITDMVPFAVILSFAMIGCMLFFTITIDSDSSRDLFGTLVNVYQMTLGIGTGIDPKDASAAAVVVVTFFMSFVVVVLLNLLIAIMGDSYEKVKMSEHVEAIRERARIVVAQEKRFPRSHRYHRFMHFVEAVDSSGKGQEIAWEGVTKMLSLEVGRLEEELNSKIDKIDRKFEQLDGKSDMLVGRLDKELVEMHRKLDMLLDRN